MTQWNGTFPLTDPTQATARLVIVLVSRLEKSGTEDRILSNGKVHFGPTDQNDQTGQSGQQYSFLNILVGPQTKMVCSI